MPAVAASGRLRAARATLEREVVLVCVLGLTGALFVYRWLFNDSRPHDGSIGWHAFHDQGFYYLEAAALARLEPIPVSDFVYGPGYPLLAAPFSKIGPLGWPSGDPFFFGNLAVWLLTIATVYLVGRRLFGEWFAVAAALALALATPLVEFVSVPFSSTAVLAALMATLLVALARGLRWWHGAILGVAVAFAYAARYVDAVWVAIAALTVLLARDGLRWRSNAWLAALVSGYVALLPVFYLHWHAFGSPLAASYREVSAYRVTGDLFTVSNIVPHALQGFVSPFYFDENGFRSLVARPMLATMFLVTLAPIGYVLFLRRARGDRRLLAIGYGIASIGATLFYLASEYSGSYGLHYGSLHYYKVWWPLWTLAAVTAVVLTVPRLQRCRTNTANSPATSRR